MAVLGSRVILSMVRPSGLPCQLKHLPRGTWHPQGMPLQCTKRHQSNEKPINLRRGEGGGVGKGGPLWSPASCSLCSPVRECDHTPPPGDHKGPPHIRPTALAPTDHPASCLASRLRLMPIECLNRSSQPIPSFRQ